MPNLVFWGSLIMFTDIYFEILYLSIPIYGIFWGAKYQHNSIRKTWLLLVERDFMWKKMAQIRQKSDTIKVQAVS